jgi:hypothetical protein
VCNLTLAIGRLGRFKVKPSKGLPFYVCVYLGVGEIACYHDIYLIWHLLIKWLTTVTFCGHYKPWHDLLCLAIRLNVTFNDIKL